MPKRHPPVSKSRLKGKPVQRDVLGSDEIDERVQAMLRVVRDWYQTNGYNISAADISWWNYRLLKWGEEANSSISDLQNNIELPQQNPEELELGDFFQASPVAAFSLWRVLQACYELDRSICGMDTQERKKIIEWRKWRPFQYLLSQEVISFCREKLDVLSSEVASCPEGIKGQHVSRCLDRIDHAVDALEEAEQIFTSVFEARGKKMASTSWMLDVVRTSVVNRCKLIQGVQGVKQRSPLQPAPCIW